LGDFLGTGATFAADFNLVAHVVMGLTLIVGMVLARRKLYTAHKYVQSSVVLLNLPLVALIMFPSFRNQVEPEIPGHLGTAFYAVATTHAVVGVVAQLLGLYIITVAGTKLLPERLRFNNFKPWMRTMLVLWWALVLLGIGTYYVWYVAPSSKVKAHAGANGAHGFVVTLKNFQFTPKTATVSPGTTVTWIDTQGMHTVHSDTNVFSSPILTAGKKFRFTFKRPGTFKYHCDFHVGIGMRAEIVVK
jgi:plastocyanin/uncharacterized membrane protein YozB (DUF420 family)